MKKEVRNTLLGLSVAAGYTAVLENVFRKYFKRNPLDRNAFLEDEKIREFVEVNRPVEEKWFKEARKTWLDLRSYDGLKLHGVLIENNTTDNYIIYSHGNNAGLMFGLNAFMNFDKLGYNILAFDHRACGESEGQYNTMGKYESLDLIAWINKLAELRPECNITLYGVSMGAASICLALGTKLPYNVKHAVSDCAFSSFKDMAKYQIELKGMSFQPLFATFELFLKARLNISMKDLDCKEALKENTVPIMFIHGTKDSMVDFECMKRLYNSTAGKKKYYPVEGADHAQCRFAKNYYLNIDRFIKDSI